MASRVCCLRDASAPADVTGASPATDWLCGLCVGAAPTVRSVQYALGCVLDCALAALRWKFHIAI